MWAGEGGCSGGEMEGWGGAEERGAEGLENWVDQRGLVPCTWLSVCSIIRCHPQAEEEMSRSCSLAFLWIAPRESSSRRLIGALRFHFASHLPRPRFYNTFQTSPSQLTMSFYNLSVRLLTVSLLYEPPPRARSEAKLTKRPSLPSPASDPRPRSTRARRSRSRPSGERPFSSSTSLPSAGASPSLPTVSSAFPRREPGRAC